MAAVPIEKLNDVIIALQSAALNYASAVLQDVQRGPGPGGALTANGATLDLEQMAIQYVRKLDEDVAPDRLEEKQQLSHGAPQDITPARPRDRRSTRAPDGSSGVPLDRLRR